MFGDELALLNFVVFAQTSHTALGEASPRLPNTNGGLWAVMRAGGFVLSVLGRRIGLLIGGYLLWWGFLVGGLWIGWAILGTLYFSRLKQALRGQGNDM